MSVGRESQRHSDAQRRQQVTFHREAPEKLVGRTMVASGLAKVVSPAPLVRWDGAEAIGTT